MLGMSVVFESDVQGNNLNLVPLVTIGVHRISTNNITLDGQYYKPILLNIPNVKSNIDIENRNYKISNATLNISNFPSDGDVFSDTLGGIINTEVDVYWMSPSCTTLEECLQVYHGMVRRATHDTDKVTLSIEDLSQSELHKELPSKFISDNDVEFDKYKNNPIPMVYGYVDKSPCVISYKDDYYYALCDDLDKYVINGFQQENLWGMTDAGVINQENVLMISDDSNHNAYIKQTTNDFEYPMNNQYEVEPNNEIRISFIPDQYDETGTIISSPIQDNMMVARKISIPKLATISDISTNFEATNFLGTSGTWNANYSGEWVSDDNEGWEYDFNADISHLLDGSIETAAMIQTELGMWTMEDGETRRLGLFSLKLKCDKPSFDEVVDEKIEVYDKIHLLFTEYSDYGNADEYIDFSLVSDEGYSRFYEEAFQQYAGYDVSDYVDGWKSKRLTDCFEDYNNQGVDEPHVIDHMPTGYAMKLRFISANFNENYLPVYVRIYRIVMVHTILIDKINSYDFYTNVIGRVDSRYVNTGEE